MITTLEANDKVRFNVIESESAGTWHRDCELLELKKVDGDLVLHLRKDSNSSKHTVIFRDVAAYKVTTEELSTVGILGQLPDSGSFYLIEDSAWLLELKQTEASFLGDAKHYIFSCYDEVIEIIASDYETN